MQHDVRNTLHDHHCPHCQSKLQYAVNAETGVANAPKEGDLSICFVCAGFLLIEKTGYSPLTENELFRLVDQATFSTLNAHRKMILDHIAAARLN